MQLALKHLFTPHYSNNHRPSILHPAGLSVVIGLFLLVQTWTKLLAYMPESLPKGLVLGYASSISADQVVELTNAERAKAGLGPLAPNNRLSQAAAAKAAHMFAHDYWAHVAPDGTTPWYFITQQGYGYTIAGENLARDFGDTSAMVQAWMDSPTHKENIVNAKYVETGVAVVDGKLEGMETTLVVQVFGAPAKSLASAGTSGSTTQVPDPLQPTAMPTLLPIKAAVSPTTTPTPMAITTANQPEPELMQAALGAVIDENRGSNGTLLSPLLLIKSVGTSILMMLIAVLVYDEYISRRSKLNRQVGKNWAHLAFFSVIMMVLLALQQGKVI